MGKNKDLTQDIRNFALQNAIKYNGKANSGAVIGRLISEYPEVKVQLKTLGKTIHAIIAEVNKIPVEEQLNELQKNAPHLLEKKEKEERDIFAFLKITDEEKKGFKTAFPPGPEKYPHIGHAKSLLLNFDLAKQQDGKFILRFEDTNPKLAKKEFYKIMQEDFAWLGVMWDKLVYASDYMDLYYKYAKQAIKDGNAYMCTCPAEEMSVGRRKGVACDCRKHTDKRNLEMWNEFPNMKEGTAVLRLKIDMKHKNTTMRDPTIFRIIDHAHPRTKKKFKVWPNYDWQNAIMDSELGIKIRIRSKEFELRNELQRHIQKILDLRPSRTYEIARFNMEGVPSSGRKIREMIEKKQLIGWDDPTLTTIRALKRRGFKPKAIHDFVISTGMTKSESTLTWDDLIIHNRRLLDKDANRYFLISDPVKITITGAPKQKVELKLHPDDKGRGVRKFVTAQEFFIEKKDFDQLKNGELYRLMDCLNFKKEDNLFVFHSLGHKDYKKEGKKIMHWLPAGNDLLNIWILMPDKSTVKALAESSIKKIKKDDVIQFERFGFCRLDKKEKSKDKKSDILGFWYTHK